MPGPSVLGPLRGLRLGFSLWRRDDRFQGSVSEPDPRSRRLKAGCHAGRALQIGAGTSPGTRARPRFRHRCKVSTLHQRFTSVRLRGPYLTRSWPRLLTRRSPRRLLIAAARADLQPASASRLREACSHLRHSFILHTARLFPISADWRSLALIRLLRVSGAGEFHPRALVEPDVSLSVHPAPIIHSRRLGRESGVPVSKQARLRGGYAPEPLPCPVRAAPKSLVFALCPADQPPIQRLEDPLESRWVEPSVVGDPSPDARVEQP